MGDNVNTWADFLISAVDYTQSPRHISRVRLHLDKGDKVGSGAAMSREVVVAWLAAGYTVATIVRSADGKWNKGAAVKAISRGGKTYIRTDSDQTSEDNLGSLPSL